MTSTGSGTRSPAEFAAAALRRAILLPLALATITGALVLGLAEHVRVAVVARMDDDREMAAVGLIYRTLTNDEMTLHHAGPSALRDRPGSGIPAELVLLDGAARRHARIAEKLRALSGLVHDWTRERRAMSDLPPAQAAVEEQKLVALRIELDTLTAELQKDEGVDEAAVRHRFAEMLALVAVLSVALGVVVALFVRRDLVVVSKSFKRQFDAEQEASRLKDEFVATLSHELRTPINAILGWTTLLRRRPDDPVMTKRALDRIERNARKQARLVDDIVDMSCIVTGQLRLSLHPVDITPILESAVTSAQAAADIKGVHVSLAVAGATGSICADARRVRQILINLVDNAVKFAPTGGRVIVGANRSDGAVQLRVSDSGQGLPRDFAPHAFDAFRQSESSSSRAHGGLGLGLAIVQRLVEMHGGTVNVQSPGEAGGATFVVTLPALAGTDGRTHATAGSTSAQTARACRRGRWIRWPHPASAPLHRPPKV